MCIAILNQEGTVLSKRTFLNSWNNNKDGGGFMYAVNGVLYSHKYMRNMETFYKDYLYVRNKIKGNIVLHFRRANQGAVDLSNCHPFTYGNIGFVHNGTIRPCVPYGIEKKSDTNIFGKRILSKMSLADLKRKEIKELLSVYIGRSKLIVMDTTGAVEIVNEEEGEWEYGNWFSNNYYKRLRNIHDRDYGYCIQCSLPLFGHTEQDRGSCYDCSRKHFRGLL